MPEALNHCLFDLTAEAPTLAGGFLASGPSTRLPSWVSRNRRLLNMMTGPTT